MTDTPRIARVETILLSIPFADGGRGEGLTPTRWSALDLALIRIDTDDGLTGWGEAFGYFCAGAVKAMMDRTITTLLLGQRADDPAALALALQRRLALFGRYGVTMFALSGIDIALWDLAARRAGKPLADLLAPRRAADVAAYASLVRYGDAATAARFTAQARDEGFGHIKLHEITAPEIEACDRVRGGAGLMVDVNGAWEMPEARRMARWLAERGAYWLEEPIFPPEDHAGLAALAAEGVALSAGENLCTRWQFRDLIAAGGVRYPQPSVTKVGGVTEFLAVAALAQAAGLTVMPHSPYFGPGYLATLHLAATLPGPVLFEYLYIWPEGWLYPDMPLPRGGRIALPPGPGLGLEPDPAAITRYRVG